VSGSWTSTLLWLVPLGGRCWVVLPCAMRRAARWRDPALATTALAPPPRSIQPVGRNVPEQSHDWVRDLG
jgi:hypothetical protein